MKSRLLIFLGIFLFVGAKAQNELDALRFSQIEYFGSSRAMGMANAFTALGVDPGSYVTNPAALGLAKFSDFSITTGFKMNQTFSEFNGTMNSDVQYALTLNHISLVFTNKVSNSPIKYWNFAYTFNRVRDFNSRVWIEGVNNKGSMIDYFVYLSDGLAPAELSDFNTGLAYDTYITDLWDTLNMYYIGANDVDGSLHYGETQRKVINSSGYGGSHDFTLAFNLNDMLFFGLAFSYLKMHYNSIETFTENNFPIPVDLKSFTFNEHITDDVTGYAIKTGLTFVPIPSVRVALSMQSPYFMKVKDVYSSSMESYWYTAVDGVSSYYSDSPLNTYIYNITSPWRVTAGIGFIIKKFFAFDAEYEYVDYSLMRMDASDYNFENENKAIRNNFYSANNFRLGGELNLGNFQIRGGMANYSGAFDRQKNLLVYAGGFGFRTSDFYFDMAFNYRTQQTTYWFYIPYEDETMPTLSANNYYLTITLGTKF